MQIEEEDINNYVAHSHLTVKRSFLEALNNLFFSSEIVLHFGLLEFYVLDRTSIQKEIGVISGHTISVFIFLLFR